jgi:methionyl-tRNA formyltransferase
MRVVFVAPEEPLILPLFFDRTLPALGDQVMAVAVVSPIYKNSGWIQQSRRFVRSFGLRWFAIEVARYSWNKTLDAVDRLVPLGRARSVRAVTRRHGIRLLRLDDVNAPDFIATLRSMDPDLVISVSCPQIFHRPLLDLPRLGCLNVHSALLPKYRGMLPTFWALLNGESETGVTVHRMEEGIDGGDIILQRRVPIAADETLLSLMRKTKRMAADLVLESIKEFDAGTVSPMSNPADEGSYFSFPTRADVDRFRALGRRI